MQWVVMSVGMREVCGRSVEKCGYARRAALNDFFPGLSTVGEAPAN